MVISQMATQHTGMILTGQLDNLSDHVSSAEVNGNILKRGNADTNGGVWYNQCNATPSWEQGFQNRKMNGISNLTKKSEYLKIVWPKIWTSEKFWLKFWASEKFWISENFLKFQINRSGVRLFFRCSELSQNLRSFVKLLIWVGVLGKWMRIEQSQQAPLCLH